MTTPTSTPTYRLSREQLSKALDGAIAIYLEYGNVHGQDDGAARIAGVGEILEGLDADQYLAAEEPAERLRLQLPDAEADLRRALDARHLAWEQDQAEIGRLRSLLVISERSVRNFSAMWQQSAAQAAALYHALSGAMELLPGGTPTDLDPTTYRIVAACDRALTADAGVSFLTLLKAVRAYRQAWQGDAAMGPLAIGEHWDAVVAALDAIEKGPTDGPK
jgi:hypothetical protein